MIFREKTDIRPQYPQIGEGTHQVAELNTIIPQKQVFTDFFPIQQFLTGTCASFVPLNGKSPVRLYIAEHDVNILCRADGCRRLSGIPVGQCGNNLIRKMGGKAVHKVQDGPHGRAFPLVYFPTFFAPAIRPVVILRHGPISGAGLLGHMFFQIAQYNLKDLRVGETQLRLLPHPPALMEGKIFRMLLKIFLRRAEGIKGMAPESPVLIPSGTGRDLMLFRKCRIPVIPVKNFPVFQNGRKPVFLKAYGQIGIKGDKFTGPGIISAPRHSLQPVIYGIHHRLFIFCLYYDIFVENAIGKTVFSMLPVFQYNTGVYSGGLLNPEHCIRDFPQIFRQNLRSPMIRPGHDNHIGLFVFRDAHRLT